jgi:hypothetical protein
MSGKKEGIIEGLKLTLILINHYEIIYYPNSTIKII